MKMVGKWILLALLIGMTLACNLLSWFGGQPDAGGSTPLMTVRYTGGFCVYGQCEALYTISADGSIHYENGAGTRNNAQLNEDELAALTEAIASADYDALRSEPFTDICPPAYDGNQVIYTFYTASGEEVIDACEFVIQEDAPLFQVVNRLIEQYSDLAA